MTARSGYNMNSSAVKRIMQEARELANDPCTDYSAAPLEDDIFEWHCTIRGTPGTEFEGGLYHFRILLPSEYPFRPPSIMMLTPNGRFELNTKICISFTNYHEELWQPAWGVRTAIIGLQGFFPLKGTAAVGVGAIEYPAVERKRLAALSRNWVCPTCQKPNHACLPDPPKDSVVSATLPLDDHADIPSQTPREGAADEAFKNPDAAATITIDPVHPISTTFSPPLLAPKPMRPIDASSIIIPTTPSRPSTPLPPTAATVPVQLLPAARSQGQVIRRETPASLSDFPSLSVRRSAPRPPILLDTAICVLLVSVFALVCRRIL